MNSYKIEITETLQRMVTIKAESIYDALDIAEKKYIRNEIELNADNSCVTTKYEEAKV